MRNYFNHTFYRKQKWQKRVKLFFFVLLRMFVRSLVQIYVQFSLSGKLQEEGFQIINIILNFYAQQNQKITMLLCVLIFVWEALKRRGFKLQLKFQTFTFYKIKKLRCCYVFLSLSGKLQRGGVLNYNQNFKLLRFIKLRCCYVFLQWSYVLLYVVVMVLSIVQKSLLIIYFENILKHLSQLQQLFGGGVLILFFRFSNRIEQNCWQSFLFFFITVFIDYMLVYLNLCMRAYQLINAILKNEGGNRLLVRRIYEKKNQSQIQVFIIDQTYDVMQCVQFIYVQVILMW
eukprot:TRINITY_DN2039_c0_g1_i7.p4 TRINITY_DN2039_c0_g1~~TRINITY_DN2039_c0_g1_i7.p4  ORF type:complete len:287 (-),score=-2.28 TRINITY_DN2039_c0_g1_i7:716-1576(-)